MEGGGGGKCAILIVANPRWGRVRQVPLMFRITCLYTALAPADEFFLKCSASAVVPHFTPLTDTSRIEGSDPQCCHACRRPENLC